jgi:hypothetical protein
MEEDAVGEREASHGWVGGGGDGGWRRCNRKEKGRGAGARVSGNHPTVPSHALLLVFLSNSNIFCKLVRIGKN